jgi:eukaryotic-like serine/threonine-protein kinase
MTAERWIRIEELYHGTLECEPPGRAAYLAEACRGDDDLLAEVEDLVRRDESAAANLLERSPVSPRQPPAVPLTPGTRLGPYEIVEPIGAGGMGMVFRAVDTRLGRSVAVKTSQAPLSPRFTREARAIASLNHPNICTLHDVGPDYLVMELIEGPTLEDRIRQGPIALQEALAIARQIAAALDAAHESGIVHRDLKPANVKLRSDGAVKVLDFGLAKSRAETERTPDSVALELSGLVLGTVTYMSPEQALGQPVDKRADIWAFGVVLYEMLTGVRPFEGSTVSDCLAGIVQKEPDLMKAPQPVRRLLDRCLQKDPKKRLRDFGDWEGWLDSTDSQRKSKTRRSMAKFARVGIPVLAVVGLAAWGLSPRLGTPPRATRFQMTLPENVAFDRYVSVSPDGQRLLFNSTGEQSGLWIHELDTLAWRRLPNTDGARSPFWSPDSRYLGFAVGTELRKIEVSGGPQTSLVDFKTVGMGSGAWSQHGQIVFAGMGVGPLHSVSADGRADTILTAVDAARGEKAHALPAFLPDGKHFLYFIIGSPEVAGVYAGSVDSPPAAQPRQRILATGAAARYVDGKLLFIREGALLAQPFDAHRLRLVGEPVRVADQVQTILSSPVFSASAGVLAYRSGSAAPGHRLVWFDRQGKEIGALKPSDAGTNPRLSPDHTRVALTDGEGGLVNIWLIDFGRGVRSRFTFSPPAENPVWSPDSARLFYSSGPKLQSIVEKAANGTGPEIERLTEPGVYHYPTSVSPDGRFLLYFTMPAPAGPGINGQTWALPLESGGRPVHLMGDQFSENRAVFSPDGRWIAYRSNESGRFQVYVRPVVYSGASAISMGEGKWQVSTDAVGPTLPVWRRDGKELYFLSERDIMSAVDIDAGHGSLRIGSPKPLFTNACSCSFDVSADAQRFLVRGTAGAGGATPITVVLNWQADLKRR